MLKKLYLTSLAGLIGPAIALAQGRKPVSSPINDLIGIKGIICQIGAFIFYASVGISIIMGIYAAYKYMTSGGNESEVSEAHKTLTYAAVGVAVAILAWGMPKLVMVFLSGGNGDLQAC
jgi:hypothetical protein